MKVKNRELQALYDCMTRIGKDNLGNEKFKWNIARNMRKLKDPIDDLADRVSQAPTYQTYNTERNTLCQDYALRDEKGEFRIDPSTRSYIIDPSRRDAFDTSMEALQAEHKEAIDAEDKRKSEIPELLATKIDIKWHIIKMSDVPEELDSTSRCLLMDLWDMGEDEPAEDTDETVTPINSAKGK